MGRFEQLITVTASHCDALHHVNNVVYVQWLQDIAAAHWNSKVPAGIDASVVWMLRKWEIEYKAQAFPDDVLRIDTWTGAHSAVTWDRHFTITRVADNQTILTATSVWILIDQLSGKPKRIDEAILNVLA